MHLLAVSNWEQITPLTYSALRLGTSEQRKRMRKVRMPCFLVFYWARDAAACSLYLHDPQLPSFALLK